MIKAFSKIFSIFIVLGLFQSSTNALYADQSCSSAGIGVTVSPQLIISGKTSEISVKVTGRQAQYKIKIICNENAACNKYASYEQIVQNGTAVSINNDLAIKLGNVEIGPGSGVRYIKVYSSDGANHLCTATYYIKRGSDNPTCTLNFEVQTSSPNKQCLDYESSGVRVYSTDVNNSGPITDIGALLKINGNITPYYLNINNGSFERLLSVDKFILGNNTVYLKSSSGTTICSRTIGKVEKCNENEDSIGNEKSGPAITLKADTDCSDGQSVRTALGCIPYEPVAFVGWTLKWGIGIGGGIAFLLMAFASFQLMTSTGNPEKIKAGQEMFVSAGAGLLFIIFSVFLLQLIGADILQIPGFTKN